jgi:dihydropteroate synthase
VGASRKSFLGRIAGVERPADRLGASIAAHLQAARLGAALLRVHDVEEHRQALAVAAALEAAA